MDGFLEENRPGTPPVPWGLYTSWIISLLSNYPLGLTEHVVSCEVHRLHSEFTRNATATTEGATAATTTASASAAHSCSIDWVCENGSVGYFSVVSCVVSAPPVIDQRTPSLALVSLSSPPSARSKNQSRSLSHLLHNKYIRMTQLLRVGRPVIFTGCKTNRSRRGLTLLPSGLLVMVLDWADPEDLAWIRTATSSVSAVAAMAASDGGAAMSLGATTANSGGNNGGPAGAPTQSAPANHAVPGSLSFLARVVHVGSVSDRRVAAEVGDELFRRARMVLAELPSVPGSSSSLATVELVFEGKDDPAILRIFEVGQAVMVVAPVVSPGKVCFGEGTVIFLVRNMVLPPPQLALPSWAPSQVTQAGQVSQCSFGAEFSGVPPTSLAGLMERPSAAGHLRPNSTDLCFLGEVVGVERCSTLAGQFQTSSSPRGYHELRVTDGRGGVAIITVSRTAAGVPVQSLRVGEVVFIVGVWVRSHPIMEDISEALCTAERGGRITSLSRLSSLVTSSFLFQRLATPIHRWGAARGGLILCKATVTALQPDPVAFLPGHSSCGRPFPLTSPPCRSLDDRDLGHAPLVCTFCGVDAHLSRGDVVNVIEYTAHVQDGSGVATVRVPYLVGQALRNMLTGRPQARVTGPGQGAPDHHPLAHLVGYEICMSLIAPKLSPEVPTITAVALPNLSALLKVRIEKNQNKSC